MSHSRETNHFESQILEHERSVFVMLFFNVSTKTKLIRKQIKATKSQETRK